MVNNCFFLSTAQYVLQLSYDLEFPFKTMTKFYKPLEHSYGLKS